MKGFLSHYVALNGRYRIVSMFFVSSPVSRNLPTEARRIWIADMYVYIISLHIGLHT